MFKWKKLGRVFNPTEIKDKYWLNEFAQAPATLLFDDFVRVYFSSRSQRDKDGQFVSYSAFIDLDRNNLFNIVNIAEKPVLQLGKKGCFDEFGTYPISVIKENDELIAYYAGWTRCVSVPFNTAIGIARSYNDGVTFHKLGDGPVLSYSSNEPFLISGPKIRRYNDTYYLFYISGMEWISVNNKPEMVLKIRIATSKDGLSWIKNDKNLIAELTDTNESQASPDVFFSNGRYHMFFDYWIPSTFRETKLRKIGYAYSIDLINWIRDDHKAGIDISTDNSFDNEMIAYPHVFNLDEKVYMFYLGNEVGRYGFGLAVLEGELE
jgi:sucrose-6-phosphate hydrolase SacC (GH32 family)